MDVRLKHIVHWALTPRTWSWLVRLSRNGQARALSPFVLFIALVGCCIWIAVFFVNIFAIFIAKYWLNSRHHTYAPFAADEDVPGVTILKPMKGVDRFLEENLRRYFLLDYPKYEIVFNVADANDPACLIAQRLISRFPHVQATLRVGADPSIINPKISNMIYGYEHARYPFIWISDSNAIVSTKSLHGLVRELQRPGIGLAHHLPRGMSSQNFAAELETVYYGTTHARMYLIAHALNINCVVGKSMLFRKADLDKLGGLRAFGRYLAEDYFISLSLKNTLKLNHALAHDTCAQPMGETTFIDYALRRIRWTRLRKNMIPHTTMVEPLSESFTNGCVASLSAYLLLSVHPINFIVFHMCCWFLCDLALIQSVHGQPIKEVKNFVIPWLVRELTYYPLYLYSLLGNTVGWRGNYFYLKRGGSVTRQQQEDTLFNRIFSFERMERYLKSPKVTSALTSFILVLKIVTEVIYRSHRNGHDDSGDTVISHSIGPLKGGESDANKRSKKPHAAPVNTTEITAMKGKNGILPLPEDMPQGIIETNGATLLDKQHGRSHSVDEKTKHLRRHHMSMSVDGGRRQQKSVSSHGTANSLSTAWTMVQIGWSMHWQNERNAREQEILDQKRQTI